MGGKPNTMRRFTVQLNGQTEGEGVRFSTGAVVYYDLPTGYIEPHPSMAESRAETSGEIVYADPDPACVYCNGWGTDHNAQCLCYGPAARLGEANLAHRTAQETEHDM